jgi:hypothetical protein
VPGDRAGRLLAVERRLVEDIAVEREANRDKLERRRTDCEALRRGLA